MTYGEDLANVTANVAKDVAVKVGESATKAVGNIAKSILEMILLKLKNRPEKIKYGKTNLETIVKSGEELKMVDMDKHDIKSFKKYAKQYGVQFAVIGNKKKDNKIITFKASDVERMEKALEAFIEEKMQKVNNLQESKDNLTKDMNISSDKEERESVQKKLENIRQSRQTNEGKTQQKQKLKTKETARA